MSSDESQKKFLDKIMNKCINNYKDKMDKNNTEKIV